MRRALMACGVITLASWGCELPPVNVTPETEVETHLKADAEAEAELTIGSKRETETEVTVAPEAGRDINLNGDSIALWISVLALGISTVSYPVARTIRLLWQSPPPSGRPPTN